MALPNKLAYHLHRHRFQNRRIYLERGLHILPNIFTLGNAFFGFCSVVFATAGDFVAAAYCILAGASMDSLDGRIARLAKTTSPLGMQLDSLCDGVSFCLAPAILMYLWQLKRAGLFGLCICALFLMAGLLRLARFNLTHEEQTIFFLGVPTPVAGCFLAALLLNTSNLIFKPLWLILLMLFVIVLAGLMVSPIPFPTFKHLAPKTYRLALAALTAFIIAMGFNRMFLLLFIAYFLFAFGRVAYNYLQKICRS
jgi:CDP-diacylglycerol--serine O-phosphatidyltransferase